MGPIGGTVLDLPNVVPPGGTFRVELEPDLRMQEDGVTSMRLGYEVEVKYRDIFHRQRQMLSCTGYDPIGHTTFSCLAHIRELAGLK